MKELSDTGVAASAKQTSDMPFIVAVVDVKMLAVDSSLTRVVSSANGALSTLSFEHPVKFSAVNSVFAQKLVAKFYRVIISPRFPSLPTLESSFGSVARCFRRSRHADFASRRKSSMVIFVFVEIGEWFKFETFRARLAGSRKLWADVFGHSVTPIRKLQFGYATFNLE